MMSVGNNKILTTQVQNPFSIPRIHVTLNESKYESNQNTQQTKPNSQRKRHREKKRKKNIVYESKLITI